MTKNKILFGLILLGALTLAACSDSSQSLSQPEEITAVETEIMEAEQAAEGIQDSIELPDTADEEVPQNIASDTQNKAAQNPDGGAAVENEPSQQNVDAALVADLPAYFSAGLVHPATGEQFTIKDHLGKVILMENMAMWCTTCLRQQGEVVALHALLGDRDDFISIGLDIDLNENADDLKVYLANHGFDWMYAVAPIEVVREIDQQLGTQFLNPSSAPMFIIDRSGQVHPLPFGVKSAAELKNALDPFLNEGLQR